MAMILNIETSTDVCSVALSKDGKPVIEKENKEGRSHASLLSYFIWQVFSEEQILTRDLDAVAISKGPGSYTGLRIGVSTAKGLCYGAGLPLISIHTLQSLTRGLLLSLVEEAEKPEADAVFIPLLDARRMEVYSAVMDRHGRFMRDVKAEVVDGASFEGWLQEHPVYFFGNGAEKCREVIKHQNARFVGGVDLSAKFMAPLAEDIYQKGQFENVAYFEPFYLKDFVATTPRKNIIR